MQDPTHHPPTNPTYPNIKVLSALTWLRFANLTSTITLEHRLRSQTPSTHSKSDNYIHPRTTTYIPQPPPLDHSIISILTLLSFFLQIFVELLDLLLHPWSKIVRYSRHILQIPHFPLLIPALVHYQRVRRNNRPRTRQPRKQLSCIRRRRNRPGGGWEGGYDGSLT